MKSGEWVLKVVPWIGGRIISMEHVSRNAISSWIAETLSPRSMALLVGNNSINLDLLCIFILLKFRENIRELLMSAILFCLGFMTGTQ